MPILKDKIGIKDPNILIFYYILNDSIHLSQFKHVENKAYNQCLWTETLASYSWKGKKITSLLCVDLLCCSD